MKTVLRFFISTTAGVAAFASVALADMHGGSMHSMSGHLRTRLQIEDNKGFTDTKFAEVIENRARLNIDLMPSDSLKVRITPQVTHNWGSLNPGNERPGFGAYEAWMSWMPNDMFGVYVGRQALSYGSGRVIGVADWSNEGGVIHDAARVVLSYDLGKTDLFVTRTNQRRNFVTVNDQEVHSGLSNGNLFGLYNAFNVADRVNFMSHVDLYGAWFYDSDFGGAGVKTNLFILGARVAGAVEMLDYEGELTTQFGEVDGVSSQKGIMGDLTVGADIMERHRFAVNAAYANSEYNTLGLADVHQFFGIADQVERNNLYSIGAMANLGLTDEFGAGVAGYYFMRANTDQGSGTLATGTSTKRPLGMELDLTLSYQPESMIMFDAGYALFKPLGAVKDATDNKVYSNLYLQGTLSF
jgi:hypothetical protein